MEVGLGRIIRISGGEDDNVAIISASWTKVKNGICLNFGIAMDVLSVDEISDFGNEFVKAVKQSYGSMLDELFYAKSESPLVSATPKGGIIMIWSFQGNDDAETKKALKNHKVKEIEYND